MSINKKFLYAAAAGAGNFNIVLYTGNSSSQALNFGFQPDLVITKPRANTGYWWVADSTRGGTKVLSTNVTTAEITRSDHIQSFTSTGVTLAADGTSNYSGDATIAYGWKANGGTTSSNTDGTITSTVQVNAEAGFSIVQYTGTQANATVGHGLGIVPKMVITKALGANQGWPTLVVGASTTFYGLRLNESNANNAGNGDGFFQSFTPNSSIFKLGSSDESNASGQTTIAYCFADVSGQSKISGYDGTGSALSITGLGFQPDFLLLKCAESTEQWYMFDSARGASKFLHPNLSNAEGTDATTRLTSFDSDGFSLGTDGAVNASGKEYIYLAFKIS